MHLFTVDSFDHWTKRKNVVDVHRAAQDARMPSKSVASVSTPLIPILNIVAKYSPVPWQ
jgi:hypothetical protein